jgi:hypothetical protein
VPSQVSCRGPRVTPVPVAQLDGGVREEAGDSSSLCTSCALCAPHARCRRRERSQTGRPRLSRWHVALTGLLGPAARPASTSTPLRWTFAQNAPLAQPLCASISRRALSSGLRSRRRSRHAGRRSRRTPPLGCACLGMLRPFVYRGIPSCAHSGSRLRREPTCRRRCIHDLGQSTFTSNLVRLMCSVRCHGSASCTFVQLGAARPPPRLCLHVARRTHGQGCASLTMSDELVTR